MDIEVTDAQKKQIIENSIRSLKQEEFDLQTRIEVYKETGGMDQKVDKSTEQLVQNRKMQAAYEKKMKEIEE